METLTFLFTSSFYPPFHLGGDAVHVSYLAEELAKRGHEVHVLHSLDAYRVKSKRLPDGTRSERVFTHQIKTPFSLSAYEAYLFGGSRQVIRRFQTVTKETRPDFVHHHNISLLGAKILRRQGNYRSVYTAHDYWLICPQNNLIRRGFQVCETASCMFCGLAYGRPPQLWRYLAGFRKAIKDIDILIAPSKYLKARMAHRLHVDAAVIPNFVPKPPGDIGSSGFSNFLLYAGGLEKHKGIVPLLESFKELAKQNSFKLIIVGEGKLSHEIHESIQKNGLEEIALPLGWVDHTRLYSLLRDAIGLVIPSVAPENAPLVALESLSVGTPVVGSNRGGLPEIVSKLSSELLFSWEDEADLRRAILFSVNNRESLSREAKRVYGDYFSNETYLESYSKLLQLVT